MRGRPRSQSARRAVLNSTRALFQKGGYAAVTMEAISERSGVAKTTIYRWWPNRPSLVVDLLMEMAGMSVPVPSGPDPLKAVRNEMRGIAAVSDDLIGRLLTSLVGEAQRDPAIRSALLNGLFHPRSAATAKKIREAQTAGLLRKDLAPPVIVDLLVGPLFYRMLVRHQPLDDAFAAQVFRGVMSGIATGRPVSRRARKAPSRIRSKRARET
jgi:AcrR family transcriptional regulator